MTTISRSATFIVIGHLLVLFLHAFAHVKLGVYASPLGNVFIVVVIWLAPLAAIAMLWAGRIRTGVIVLLGAMSGSLLFGLYHHFIVISPDHVSHVPAGDERELFQITAVLLAVVEAAGSSFGVWAWRVLRRDA
ncbi:MAG: hypothetical protein ACREOO_21875 [bacterium]